MELQSEPPTQAWKSLKVFYLLIPALIVLMVVLLPPLPDFSLNPSCQTTHHMFSEFSPSSPAVAKFTVIPCGQEFEGERQRTTTALSELRNGSTAAQAIEVVKELYEVSSPIEESAEGHVPDINVDFIVKWINSGTAYRLSSYKYHASIEFPECLLDLEGIDTFAGRTGIHTVKAKCEEVTVDRGELPAVPTAMVTKRSDLPQSIPLKEIFTVGAWSVEVIPSEGWTLPQYPFDDLLEAAQGNTEWTNVDWNSRPAPSQVIIQDSPHYPPAYGESTPPIVKQDTFVEFPMLNGPDPGLDREAVQRIRHFLDTHPGIGGCTMLGMKDTGWLSTNPMESEGWSAN